MLFVCWLVRAEGDEVAALMRLFRAEVLRTIPGLWDDWPCASAAGDEPEEWEREDGALDEATAWEEERVAIEAIFADDATCVFRVIKAVVVKAMASAVPAKLATFNLVCDCELLKLCSLELVLIPTKTTGL